MPRVFLTSMALRLIGEMRAPALVASLNWQFNGLAVIGAGAEGMNPITVSQTPKGNSTKSELFVMAGTVAGTDTNADGSWDTVHVDLLRRIADTTVEPTRRAGAKDDMMMIWGAYCRLYKFWDLQKVFGDD